MYEKSKTLEQANAPLKAAEFDQDEQLQINKSVRANLLPVPEPHKKR